MVQLDKFFRKDIIEVTSFYNITRQHVHNVIILLCNFNIRKIIQLREKIPKFQLQLKVYLRLSVRFKTGSTVIQLVKMRLHVKILWALTSAG